MLVGFSDKVECSSENLRCFVGLVKCLRRTPKPNFLLNGPRFLAWHCTKLRVPEPSQAWNSIHLVNILKLTSKCLKKIIKTVLGNEKKIAKLEFVELKGYLHFLARL